MGGRVSSSRFCANNKLGSSDVFGKSAFRMKNIFTSVHPSLQKRVLIWQQKNQHLRLVTLPQWRKSRTKCTVEHWIMHGNILINSATICHHMPSILGPFRPYMLEVQHIFCLDPRTNLNCLTFPCLLGWLRLSTFSVSLKAIQAFQFPQ